MEWVHCNCCNRQPSENKKFCLTNCGHIFCEECVVQDKEPCKVCDQICMVLPLIAPLKPEVAIYFSEPYEMLQNYFKEFTKIMEFQKGHGKKLIAGFKARICTLNDKLQDALKKIGVLENENENLKKENIHLREILNNSPFRGVATQVGGPVPTACPTSLRLSMCYSASTCSSTESSTLVKTPTISEGILSGQQQQQRRSSFTTTPMTSKRLSIHTPQREVLLSGNSSGSMFSRRSHESQTLKMLSQSPAFSSSVSNKRHASNAGHNPTTPNSRPHMTRNPSMSLPGVMQRPGHHVLSATYTREYNRRTVLKRNDTPDSSEQLSPLRRPISLKVDYPSLRSEMKNYFTSKSNLPTPSWRH